MDYRRRMRELREDHDMSQAEAGALINKSQQGYSHIENGRAELKIEDLITLCDHYGVTADYFIGRSESEKQNRLPGGTAPLQSLAVRRR